MQLRKINTDTRIARNPPDETYWIATAHMSVALDFLPKLRRALALVQKSCALTVAPK
jgi:hypothetical protein